MKAKRRYPQNMTIDGQKMTVTQWKREMRSCGLPTRVIEEMFEDAWSMSLEAHGHKRDESDKYCEVPLEVALEAKLVEVQDFGIEHFIDFYGE